MARKFSFLLILVAIAASFFFFRSPSFAPIVKEGEKLVEAVVPPPPLRPDLTWSASSTAPWRSRDAGATFVWPDAFGESRIWFLGGVDGEPSEANPPADGVKYWELPHFHDVWSFNGVTWREESKAAAWPPRRSMSVADFQGKLWMMGGWSPISGYRSDVWTSTDGATWSLATSSAAWPPREGQTIAVFNGKLWMMGGVDFDKRINYHDVWSSSDGLNWELATTSAAWSGRYDQAVEVFDGKLWLTGGVALGGMGQSDVWSSADGTTWTLVTATAPWGKRHGLALLNWHDYLWIVSGWDTTLGQGSPEVWFSKDGLNWQETESAPPWLGREDHAALIYQDKLWMFAGMDTNWHWNRDVWSAEFKLN